MSKIRTKKVVFSFLPPKLINIVLLFSLGGPFGVEISSNEEEHAPDPLERDYLSIFSDNSLSHYRKKHRNDDNL